MRRKPASYLQYMIGSIPESRAAGFRTARVYCVGSMDGQRCWHNAQFRLADLPQGVWAEVSARFRRTVCSSVGYVHVRLNWSEIQNTPFTPGYGLRCSGPS